MKKGIQYFSMDVDFFTDSKIQFVDARFGAKGIVITIRLLTLIYRQGYYITWNDDEAFLLAKSVGDNVTASLVSDVVQELVKRGFFNEELFNSFKILTSRGIQERYLEACKRRKLVEIDERYLLYERPEKIPNLHVLPLCTQNDSKCIRDVNISDKNVYISDENVHVNGQSKESKVKKVNKERKESKTVLFYLNHFGDVNPFIGAQLEELIDFHGDEEVEGALKIAVERGVRKLNYVKGILNSKERDASNGGYNNGARREVDWDKETDEW